MFADSEESEVFGRESTYPVSLDIPHGLHTIRVLPTKSGNILHTVELVGGDEVNTTGDHSSEKGEWGEFRVGEGEFACGVKGGV